MGKHLLVLTGPDKGLVCDLGDSTSVSVGRGRQAGFRLSDPHVSRSHCQVETVNGRLVLRDAGSLGGTFVNGERITERLLQPGDVIIVGKTWLRLQEEDLADQATLLPEGLAPAAPRAEAPAPPRPEPGDLPPLEVPAAPPVEAPSAARKKAPTVPRSDTPPPSRSGREHAAPGRQ